MFKESIRYPIIYFVVLTVWQIIKDQEIRWFENIFQVTFIFLIFLFYNWTKIPYDWKKNKEK